MHFIPADRALLRRPATPVAVEAIATPAIREICVELLAFASGKTSPLGSTKPRRLVGVSATQVGIDLAIVYANVTSNGEWTEELRLLINPRIVRVWGEDEPVEWWHGCFSTQDLVTIRSLPRFMLIEYYDEHANLQTWFIDGAIHGARQLHVVRHEIDHVLGVRHVDAAITDGEPIYVVYPNEQSGFNFLFLRSGKKLSWHRTLRTEGWDKMLAGQEWHDMIIQAAG